MKAFVGTYNDWDILSLLNIYNKKKQVLKIYLFINFYKIIKHFINLINYYCNFSLTFSKFMFELFYNTGFINSVKLINKTRFFLNYFNSSNKFQNSFFNSYINNYYLSDFYTKNSKIMSYSSLKKYRIFKII
jgi:hypothetical protein